MNDANDINVEYFCPKNHVEPKEDFYFALCIVISVIFYLLFIIASGLGIIVVLLSFFVVIFLTKMAQITVMAQLKQNAIRVTEKQFSLIYEKSKEFCNKLKIKKIPEIYIIQSSGVLNAFATRLFFKDYVILNSDIVELAYKEGDDAVAFVVAHELAHLHRKHLLKYSWTAPALLIPFLKKALSRAFETTCDNIAAALVPNNSLEGLLVLLAGKELYKKVNVNEFLITANNDYNHSAWVAEIRATHPYLSRRLYNIAKKTNQKYIANLPKDMFKVSKFACFISCFVEIIVWFLIITTILGVIAAFSYNGIK